MLEINPPLLVMTVIFFLIMIFTLNKILYKPMLAFMARRDAIFADSKSSVNESSAEVVRSNAEAEAILQAARDEATRLKNEALNSTRQAMEAKIATRRAELTSDYENFVANLATERAELREKLEADMPKFKEALTQKLAQI